MQANIVSIGTWKEGPFAGLFHMYSDRCMPRINLSEVEVKYTGSDIKAKEAEALRKLIPHAGTLVACDEHGKQFSSREFAGAVDKFMQINGPKITFLIGGADGLDPGLVKQAHLVLSFGRMTWPHMMARVMLAEQIYRAQTILSNHPYHRD